MDKEIDKSKILKAGKIASQVKVYARSIVKKDIPLLEIAEKIEAEIFELGGKPAFPVNLSINEIAAHYTPSHDDEELARGLLKVDFGVHIDGWTADNAFSVDLEDSEENKKLIEASKQALKKVLDIIKPNISTDEIGSVINKTIESHGFSPVINLCGHSMEHYNLHAGVTIPNINDGRNIQLKEGLYAIEPFATPGSGKIRDGRPSGIYELRHEKSPRSSLARELMQFIKKEYGNLPFCSRWIVKNLGSKYLFGLRELEVNGNLHQFTQLIEISGRKVSQAEETILIDKEGNVTVTTL
jgi:methionyl aminopeptidase